MGILDKFASVSTSNTARPAVSFLDAPGKAIAAASINITDATNWPTDKVHFAIYNKTAEGKKDITTQSDWIATRSTTTLSNLSLTGGTDRAYNAGAIVEITPTYRWAKDLYDGITLGHNVLDGTHKTFTETNIVPTAAIQALAVNNSKLAADISPAKFSNPYKFHVYCSANWTDGNNAYATVPLNVETFDTNNNWNITNYTYTVPLSGYYQLSGCVKTHTKNGAGVNVAVLRSGAILIPGHSDIPVGYDGVFEQGKVVTGLVYMAANDVITLASYGGGYTGLGGGPTTTFFSGFLVSTT
jgi:hypothetical protein